MYISDLKHSSATLESKLQSLYRLNTKDKCLLGFRAPFLSLLEKLGNPHLRLPPVIHVAGTNGKGSTIAFLRSIIQSAGFTVHAYTSPHLIHFNERIVLSGRAIDDHELESCIDEILRLNDGAEISFFEITTALAFQAFANHPADIVLLEVGLGGRLDCTNIIPKPLLSLITAIGMDHTEFLGESLSLIATEKAGIIKPHTPCVLGYQNAPFHTLGIRQEIQAIADAHKAPLICAGSDWSIKSGGEDMDTELIEYLYQGEPAMPLPRPALAGQHQIENLGLAVTALHLIKDRYPVAQAALKAGITSAFWPARLQSLPARSLNMDTGWTILLDGAHNADAATRLAEHIKNQPQPIHGIIGMMAHKNARAFLAPLLPHLSSLHFIPIPGEPKAVSPQDLSSIAEGGLVHPDLHAALAHISRHYPQPGQIIIGGSLYLAGNILKNIEFSGDNE